MALTVTLPIDGNGLEGNKRSNRGTLALDSSYPAGGYPLVPRAFGLSVLESLFVTPRLGYLFDWDQANATLRVFRPNELTTTGSQAIGDPLQVASGVLGTTGAGNQSVRTRGPVEVATATDLSTVTAAVWAAKGV